MLSKDYEPKAIEGKWQKEWEKRRVYKFDLDSDRPIYSIDTPPAYPTGNFHLGNALNWIYFDIVARYKRMQGYEVMFPQGWDCHGLPTEVQVEKKHGIKKGDIPREEFRKLCIELTQENIEQMKRDMVKLGFSIDWDLEYKTLDSKYWGKTQLSFIKLYKKGLIYRGEHPVEWCPRCQTAIAHAEVEYEDRGGILNTIIFKKEDGEPVKIATTRPELLCSCVAVAVNPEDERHKELIGRKLEIPLYGNKVEVLEDPGVDPGFGTGVVMICTFGDREDVKWMKKYGLPVIQGIDERGKMTEKAGKYKGLSVKECKAKIIKDLEKENLIAKKEEILQKVGMCWRCKTPVEILPYTQWFMDVSSWREDIVNAADKVKWVPEHMKLRLQNWAKTMEWDWVLSRQRIFATPIPVWYCKKCGEALVAREKEVPIDPTTTPPKKKKCKCGSKEFRPEEDVFDTWMDSSITIAVHAGWPDIKSKLFKHTFPADLQPNGTDIIRTWDYYLLVRHLALLGKIPYKTILINGMVVGEDGRKMSKSLGNYVMPSEPIDKHGSDAVRQWAAMGGATGSDIPFSWKDVKFGYRFLRKFWNAVRFAEPHIKGVKFKDEGLEIQDKWILSRLNKLVRKVTRDLEEYRFDRAIGSIHNFVWHQLCDVYIEEIKHRLYNAEKGNEKSRKGAQRTLGKVIFTIIKLMAPFTPHFSEEIYFTMPSKEKSIHTTPWPRVEERYIDEKAEETGEIINNIISRIRSYKASKGMPLNYELDKVVIYASEGLVDKVQAGTETIKGTVRTNELDITTKPIEAEERIIEIVPDFSKIGPEFGEYAKKVVEVLNANKDEFAREFIGKGKGAVKIGGREFMILQHHIKDIKKEVVREGEKIDILDVPEHLKIMIAVSKKKNSKGYK